ncbi:hypothetical protein JTB14_015131 [Gonioctena quinquepunctata]|nr:hypothetical protein JTB14_015131 [Gonioctena quinquepunctata]
MELSHKEKEVLMQVANQSEMELNDSLKEHKKIITEVKKLIEDLQNEIATKNNKRCIGTQTKPVVQKTIGISTHNDEFSAVGRGLRLQVGKLLLKPVDEQSVDSNTGEGGPEKRLTNPTITDLSTLEVLGIQDPTDRKTKIEIAEEAEELLNDTTTIDKERKYEVRLPWVENHPPLPTNYNIAKTRLGSTLQKLENGRMTSRTCRTQTTVESTRVSPKNILKRSSRVLPSQKETTQQQPTAKTRDGRAPSLIVMERLSISQATMKNLAGSTRKKFILEHKPNITIIFTQNIQYHGEVQALLKAAEYQFHTYTHNHEETHTLILKVFDT